MRTPIPRRLALLSLLLVAACDTTPQRGFTGPGCYDYRGTLEPSIVTPAECRSVGLEWHVQDWAPAAAKKTP